MPHHALRAWNLPADSVPGLSDPVPQAARDSDRGHGAAGVRRAGGDEAIDWFGEVSPHLRAFACIPLARLPNSAAPLGLLVLASEEEKRFYAGMGTLYLERLGQLIGAALLRMQG